MTETSVPTARILLGAVPTWSAKVMSFIDIEIPAPAMARIEAAAETASMRKSRDESLLKFTNVTASLIDSRSMIKRVRDSKTMFWSICREDIKALCGVWIGLPLRVK